MKNATKILALCLIESLSACQTRTFQSVNSSNKNEANRSESNKRGGGFPENVATWLNTRMSTEQLNERYEPDIESLGKAFSKSGSGFYQVKQPATIAQKILADALPFMLENQSQDDVKETEPWSEERNLRKLHFCASYPESKLGKVEIEKLTSNVSNLQSAAFAVAARSGIEAMDLLNLSLGGKSRYILRHIQVHVAKAGEERIQNNWHIDGGYLFSTLTLIGKGTEFKDEMEAEKAGRVGRFLFLSAKEDNEGFNTGISHRASMDTRQRRITFIFRFVPQDKLLDLATRLGSYRHTDADELADPSICLK